MPMTSMVAIAEDLLEGTASEPGPGQDRNPGFAVAGRGDPSVDSDHHDGRRRLLRSVAVVQR
ncbi:MAG: hypothetical protein ACRDWS_10200, partial [Acidimicrobiia bacterium]